MKVLHLDSGSAWRGGQAQVYRLLRGLAARGHASRLLAPPGPLLERARAAGIEARSWRPRGDGDLGAGWAVARALAAGRPHLLHCHDARSHAVGALPARLLGVPLVVSRRVALGPRRNPLSRLKYRRGADRYLCVSRGAMEQLERAGVARARLALVPSGVPLEPGGESGPAPGGATVPLREQIGAPPAAPVVGTIAALTAEKDPFTWLEAAALVTAEAPQVHFVWAGEGPGREELERRRGRAGLDRIHLLGFRWDARALLRQFTVFVLASTSEGLGSSLLDAQVEGVPVVATAVGGIPEVVEDGVSGRLVEPGNPRALAAALTEALGDDARRRRWAAAARRSVSRFGEEAMVERTLEQYRAVLEERGGCGTP